MTDPLASLPQLPDYGAGIYRRRIRLLARPGRVIGELQDDFHHFAVELRHDGVAVTGVRGGGLRVPWTTCGGAVAPLERLRGLPLKPSLRAAPRYTDPRAQCTHLFDLAGLAVAHAARAGARVRCYDVSVPDRVAGRTRAALDRDGERLLDWEIEGARILEPAASTARGRTGRPLSGSGFRDWAESLGEALAEAAQVLRRAVLISAGRRFDFDRMADASEFAPVVGAACHTFSPERIGAAKRIPGSRRDFGRDSAGIFAPGFSEAFGDFDPEGDDA